MIRPAPSPDLRRRAVAGLSLLLALLPGLGTTVFVADDHHFQHGHGEPGTVESHVVLHHSDGDHHHEAARLEHGQSELHGPCILCARLGKTSVLVPRPVRVAIDLAPLEAWRFSVQLPALGERRGPRQPRAPPRV